MCEMLLRDREVVRLSVANDVIQGSIQGSSPGIMPLIRNHLRLRHRISRRKKIVGGLKGGLTNSTLCLWSCVELRLNVECRQAANSHRRRDCQAWSTFLQNILCLWGTSVVTPRIWDTANRIQSVGKNEGNCLRTKKSEVLFSSQNIHKKIKQRSKRKENDWSISKHNLRSHNIT